MRVARGSTNNFVFSCCAPCACLSFVHASTIILQREGYQRSLFPPFISRRWCVPRGSISDKMHRKGRVYLEVVSFYTFLRKNTWDTSIERWHLFRAFFLCDHLANPYICTEKGAERVINGFFRALSVCGRVSTSTTIANHKCRSSNRADRYQNLAKTKTTVTMNSTFRRPNSTQPLMA